MATKLEDCYVLLAPDEATSMRVRTIKTLQNKFNMPYRIFYPHLTIAHFPLADRKQLARAIKKLSKKYDPIDLNFIDVKIIDKVLIAIEVDNNKMLEEIYDSIHKMVPFTADKWTSPNEPYYLPHVSLYFNPEIDLEPMYEHFKKGFTPFQGEAVAIELSVFDGKSYTITHRFPLKKRLF